MTLFDAPAARAERRPWPRVADEADYIRMFATTGSSAFSMIVNNFSLTTVGVATVGLGRDQNQQVPSIALHIAPDTLDFTDPATGFDHLMVPVPNDRVLRLWADDLLTVTHGTAWTFIIDSPEAFDRTWLEDGFLAAGADVGPPHAVITVCAGTSPGHPPSTAFDLTMPSTLARLEDCRTLLTIESG